MLRLTAREREVLELMAEGRSNTAIAESLVVTPGAVEKHITNIFAKLDLAGLRRRPPARAGGARLSARRADRTVDRLTAATAATCGGRPATNAAAMV